MPNILPYDRFTSEYSRIQNRYEALIDQFPDDEKWKKVKRNIIRLGKCYHANKILAIKTLRSFEKYQLIFQQEKRACIVQAIELLKKILWHKKINKEF